MIIYLLRRQHFAITNLDEQSFEEKRKHIFKVLILKKIHKFNQFINWVPFDESQIAKL